MPRSGTNSNSRSGSCSQPGTCFWQCEHRALTFVRGRSWIFMCGIFQTAGLVHEAFDPLHVIQPRFEREQHRQPRSLREACDPVHLPSCCQAHGCARQRGAQVPPVRWNFRSSGAACRSQWGARKAPRLPVRAARRVHRRRSTGWGAPAAPQAVLTSAFRQVHGAAEPKLDIRNRPARAHLRYRRRPGPCAHLRAHLRLKAFFRYPAPIHGSDDL
jgi:hypothetical protein